MYLNENLIQNNYNDINEYIQFYRNQEEVLSEYLYQYGKFNNFDSNEWIVYYELRNYECKIGLSKFQDIINKEEIDLIKCYIVELFLDGYSILGIKQKIYLLSFLYHETNNFELKIIQSHKCKEIIQVHDTITTIKDYFYFLDGLDCISEGQSLMLHELENTQIIRKINIRKLPSDKDIFTFSFYLEKFYKEETDEVALNLFKPILLWWKITNIIPLRPSEFTCKLKRDCLEKIDNKYYIKIKRIKIKNKKKFSIPILNKIEITKEIYDLIENYIQVTSFDTDTTTLLAFYAQSIFRHMYHNNYDIKEINNVLNSYKLKRKNVYIDKYLNNLINFFYDEIIEKKYKYLNIERRLRPGDTRHLAFSYLLLQGISPIEIAILGGHTCLESQDYYVSHTEYYINSEVFKFISNNEYTEEILNKNLKNIIFSKDEDFYIKIDENMKTEDGIGYCTANFEKGDICEEDICIFCSKWWCFPCNESYTKIKEYIEKKYILSQKEQLKCETNFLNVLFKRLNIINIDNLQTINNDDENELTQQIKKLKRIIDDIILFQKSLLDLDNLN